MDFFFIIIHLMRQKRLKIISVFLVLNVFFLEVESPPHQHHLLPLHCSSLLVIQATPNPAHDPGIHSCLHWLTQWLHVWLRVKNSQPLHQWY